MSEKRYKLVCKQCKKPFVAKISFAMFCSGKCKAQWHRDKKATDTSKIIQSQRQTIRAQDELIRSVPAGTIKDKQPVINYLIMQVGLYQAEGYDWIRMETIQNLSSTLFGTPGMVPDEFFIGGYDFKRIDAKRYSFEKR